MAEYYNRGDSIEGRKLDVFSRKIEKSSTLLNCGVLGRCVKYKCDRNASAEITQELTEVQKSNLRNKDNSKLGLSDKLKCDALFVLHEGCRHLSITKDEGATHTHGGQYINTKTRSYSEITTPFEQIEKALLKRKRELGLSLENGLVSISN